MYAFDPEKAVRHLRAVDPKLGRLIDAVGPFRLNLRKSASVFSSLTEAIVSQQLSGAAARTIHARLTGSLAGTEPLTAAHVLSAADTELRAAGLSRPKILALRDLARRVLASELPTLAELHAMDEEAIILRLTEVRGIGRWTVEMLLMFTLGRADVLPVNDLGIQKGFRLAFRKRAHPTPKVLGAHGARWKPYRTVASWYLWRALELPSASSKNGV